MEAPPLSGQSGMSVRKWLVIFVGYTICSTDPLELKAFTESILGFFFVVTAMGAGGSE